ncbi:hypothetical protein LCGC14_2170440, partial [marine sediment metagenome]
MKEYDWKLIPISSMYQEGRARTDYGELETLMNSMLAEEGQIHNFSVKKMEDGRYKIIAGGRRHAALQLAVENELIQADQMVMAHVYPTDIDPLLEKVVELNENLMHKPMEWQEELKIQKQIHDLQVARFGQSTSANVPDGWSQQNTAELTGRSKASVSQDLQLAVAIEEIPALANAGTKSDAMKIMKQVAKEMDLEARAQKVDDERDDTPAARQKKELCDSYIVGDFFELVKGVPDGVVDLVEVDPPYGINIQDYKPGESTLDYNEVDAAGYEQFLVDTLLEAYRIMSPNSWLIFWFAPDPWWATVEGALERTGFSFNRRPALWTKPSGMCTNPNTNLASDWEPFFYARKGTPEIQRKGRSSQFAYSPVV